MTVKELAKKMDLRIFEPGNNLDRQLKGGYASDLLSDVMGNARQDEAWITLQNHLNIVAVASLKDLAAIILVHGQEPAEDVLMRAREEGITLLGTEWDTYRTSAEVYFNLNQNENSTN